MVKIDADAKIGADTSGDRVHGTRHSSSADRNFGYADFVTKAVALLTVLTAAAFTSLRTPGGGGGGGGGGGSDAEKLRAS